jgi:hypothetical protein
VTNDRAVYKGLRWDVHKVDITPAMVGFLLESPSPAIAVETRLEYFARFLDADDATVASVAFFEFANAIGNSGYKPAPALPREKIRKWLLDPSTPSTRHGIYGIMLGAQGNPGDAIALEQLIADKGADEDRLGLSGLVAGYLLLTGEEGLKFINVWLRGPRSDGERYDVVLASRYIRRHGNGKISKKSLNGTLKLFLDSPDLAEIVIHELLRVRDWSLQKTLVERYGIGDFDERGIKRAIIIYMIAATKDLPKSDEESEPQHVTDGQRYLEQLRTRDPEVVTWAEKNFSLYQ